MWTRWPVAASLEQSEASHSWGVALPQWLAQLRGEIHSDGFWELSLTRSARRRSGIGLHISWPTPQRTSRGRFDELSRRSMTWPSTRRRQESHSDLEPVIGPSFLLIPRAWKGLTGAT